MSLPPPKVEPAIEVWMRGVPPTDVGRYASRSRSTWGVPGASTSGAGDADAGSAGGLSIGRGVGRVVGVAVACAGAVVARSGARLATAVSPGEDGEGPTGPTSPPVHAARPSDRAVVARRS